MKQILTVLFILCTFTASSQDVVVTGPKRKPQTSVIPKPKPNTQAKPKPQTSPTSKPKPKTSETTLTPPIHYPHPNQTIKYTVNSSSFYMCYVKGGSFIMGATSEQGSDTYDDEKPTHKVTLSDYYIGQTEVTQALWKAVMGNNPSSFKGDILPVESVSWNDCQSFLEKLNAKTGRTFRLPTEAEWEFAARGGNNSLGYKYSGSNYINDVAWFDSNSNNTPHPVASKHPNELGIYDMSGNVWEWCSDWYGNYNSDSQTNPGGADNNKSSSRVYRGGSWYSIARTCRLSNRDYTILGSGYSNLGLRLVLVP